MLDHSQTPASALSAVYVADLLSVAKVQGGARQLVFNGKYLLAAGFVSIHTAGPRPLYALTSKALAIPSVAEEAALHG